MASTTRAVIYTRISSDDGSALGVKRQERDCQELAVRRGWTVVAVFTDNDVSASTGRTRPAFQRMLTALRSGDASALLVWDLDRLTRAPREIEDFMEAVDRHGWELASVGGDVDLSTPQGRLVARIKGSVARHEAEQASRRIKRKTDERAQAGEPHGRVAFGWRRVVTLNDLGRTSTRDEVDDEEANVIREAARRVLADEPLRSIVRDLNARSVLSPTGKAWEGATLRQALLRERNAGLRRHRGEVIGQAAWEPILDVSMWEQVRAVLTDPRRRTSPGPSPTWLLSGIARCGPCGAGVRVLKPGPRASHRYVCPKCFRVSRVAAAVDELVVDVLVGRLARKDAARLFAAPQRKAADALADAASLRQRLDDAADTYAAGQITAAQLARITAQLRPLLDAAEARARGALAVPDLADLTTPRAADVWTRLPLDRRRAVVRALLDVTILPTAPRGAGPIDPDGVDLQWKRPAA